MPDGATLLRDFLSRHSVTQIAAATALGVSDPTVCDWLKGTKRPRTHHREALSVWTNGEVPVESWLLDAEAEKMANVRPFVATPESGDVATVDESTPRSA